MHAILKTLLGLVALVAILGIGFYIWLVIAYTPPKGPANPAQEGIVKQGVTDTDFVVYYGIGWRDTEKGRQYEVDVGPPTDDMSGEVVLRSWGAPTPIDIRAPAKGKIEILFDGNLADGHHSIVLHLDKSFRTKKIVEVINGVIQ